MRRIQPVSARYAWTHKLPFFYGWVVVFLGAFTLFSTTPGQSDSFSLFMNSFIETFGWSRTFVSSLYSTATLASGVLMFLIGRLIDRIGSKAVAILSAIVLGTACMVLSFVMSPVMLFAGFFLARLSGKGALDLTSRTFAPQWFLSRRALAVMLVGLGGALGGMIFPLLNNYLILTFGWRIAYRILAGGLWILYVPITLLLLVNRPEDVGMSPLGKIAASSCEDGGEVIVQEPAFKQSQAIRTSAFWILTFVVFQSSLVGTGVILHFVSILETGGFNMTFAATIMGIKPLVAVITTVLAGLVLDRIRHHHVVLAVTCFMQVAAFMLLAFLRSAAMAYLYAIIGGMAGGVAIICIGVLKPNLFGRRYLGGILGVTAALNVIGSAIGPIIFGAAFDGLGGYREIIILSSMLPLLAGILCLFVRAPIAKACLGGEEQG
ncbi:MFS transporter [Candidatus Bipolaricaulota bacterium]